MDRIAQWRPIEPAGPEGQAEQTEPKADGENVGPWRLLLIAGIGAAVLTAAGLALWATTPQPQLVLQPFGQSDAADVGGVVDAPPDSSARPVAEPDLVVDVQGAVERPGLHRLPAGSRVGDAIASAGGYSPQVDIAASAQRLNLAQRLQDGDKIHVPARGEQLAVDSGPASPGAAQPAATAPGGPINVNTAPAEQLDTLPGIGPVTAAKIIAAREEAPFATVDELLSRGVVGPATYEKISELVTVGP